jgi:CheY-like chemotaxis protein
LLVDDHDDTREMYAQFFTAMSGLDVSECAASENAFAVILETQPDVVVTDYVMPTLDGGELCRQLKAHPDTRRIPVVMLTGDANVLVSETLRETCALVLMKPCGPDDLASHIRTVIAQGERATAPSAE